MPTGMQKAFMCHTMSAHVISMYNRPESRTRYTNISY